MSQPALRESFAAIPNAGDILSAIPDPLFLLDKDEKVCFANAAAEQFLGAGLAILKTRKLEELFLPTSPLLALVGEARRRDGGFAEYDVELAFSEGRRHLVDAHVIPMSEHPGFVLVALQPRSVADSISRSLTHRSGARTVSAMATMLAHEIKNPLSGIRGAAQLLEDAAESRERKLTQLICKEADRIVALIDRMEDFTDSRPVKCKAENIHEILDHVIAVAHAGFARHMIISQRYDPSLPPVYGHRDQLIQAFLNLVKNAVEAAPTQSGEVTVTTGYRHGVRVALAGSNRRLNLPIEVCIIDNGEGIAEELRPYLFEPFVTNKAQGKGLGLAMVAKVIGAHGGIIDCERIARHTQFRVLLPATEEK